MKKQDFKVLKTKDLYPFPDNPFHVVEDETLSELAESIKEFGIVTPIITRPKEDGNGYEVIAGQRRVRASELAVILSRLVDTFSSRILYPMRLPSGNYSIAVV